MVEISTKGAIAKHAGTEAAKTIAAAVAFDVTEIRPPVFIDYPT